MELKVFSIHDKATQAFNQPFFMLTNSEAIRAFQNMARDPDSQISKNPLDFHLYRLGTYDNTTGEVTNDLHDLGAAALFKQEDNVEDLFPAKEIQK